MKLLRSQWMQELDGETIHSIGIPSIVLMENASRGAADFYAARFPLEAYPNIIVVAGKGNNGGDGIAVGRILHQKGYHVHFILLAEPDKLNADPKINFHIIQKLKLPYSCLTGDSQLDALLTPFKNNDKNNTVIIDAIFGTGIDRPVKSGRYADIIRAINRSPFKVAAIDIPSGLSDAFLPQEGLHVNADVTATFQCLKTAHLHPDGNKYCGQLAVIDIGIPWERVNQEKYYIHITTPASIKHLLTKRDIDAHKGTFGHGLTVAGSLDKPGAGILSAYSLLKSGAGLCTAAVAKENRLAPVTAHPELMTLVYQKNDQLRPHLSQFDAILAGPGLGDTAETFEKVSFLAANTSSPLVLDADAVNVLAGEKGTQLFKAVKRPPMILTPHPGEFSRLTGLSVSDIRRDRIGSARDFAVKNNVYIILKGHHTVIASPSGQVYVNPTGNAGMATAGSGDVLAGMITGMLCAFLPHPKSEKNNGSASTKQNISPKAVQAGGPGGALPPPAWRAPWPAGRPLGEPPEARSKYRLDQTLQLAVFAHGLAGDLAAQAHGEICLTASDITAFIPQALKKISDHKVISNETDINHWLS